MTAAEMDALIRSYRASPRPERVPELLAFVRESGMLARRETEMPVAAAVLALAEAHWDLAPGWREAEKDLFAEAARVLAEAGNRPGRNDAALVRWRILGRDEDAREMVAACAHGDQRGASARWMLAAHKGDAALMAAIRPHLKMLSRAVLAEMGMRAEAPS